MVTLGENLGDDDERWPTLCEDAIPAAGALFMPTRTHARTNTRISPRLPVDRLITDPLTGEQFPVAGGFHGDLSGGRVMQDHRRRQESAGRIDTVLSVDLPRDLLYVGRTAEFL